jgi:hypothetical protein
MYIAACKSLYKRDWSESCDLSSQVDDIPESGSSSQEKGQVQDTSYIPKHSAQLSLNINDQSYPPTTSNCSPR